MANEKPGPTGDFPEGQLSPMDEGGLMIALSIYAGNVKIDFGKPIAWFAMPPVTAENFAKRILAKAEEARKKAQ